MGSHKVWRAQAKKTQRKRIRQKLAQERDSALELEEERRLRSPRYQVWLSEQRALELFAEEEETRLAAERNAEWLAEEARAQTLWKERQEKLSTARAERAKQELRIREEWEEEQRKIKAVQEEQRLKAEEKMKKQEELMRQIEDFINKGGDMPSDVNVASVTNPEKPPCPFFTKTGACRFGDRCSRNHTRPGISRVLLVSNFYDHIGLRPMNREEFEGADDWLEYDDSETYQHFLDFYEDVLPEWERIGRISQFKVCCNLEPHLRGNVYIEYESARDAVRAYKLFNGRWYGGKQMSVEFVTINSWKAAICGQFHKQRCPKGRSCNFLHVFRNPGNAFYSADHDRQAWRRKHYQSESQSHSRSRSRSWSRSPDRHSKRSKDWRWSASPSPPSSRNGYLREHHRKSHHRRDSPQRSGDRSSRKDRSARKHNRGRNKSRDRSRSTDRRRNHGWSVRGENSSRKGRDSDVNKIKSDDLSKNSPKVQELERQQHSFLEGKTVEGKEVRDEPASQANLKGLESTELLCEVPEFLLGEPVKEFVNQSVEHPCITEKNISDLDKESSILSVKTTMNGGSKHKKRKKKKEKKNTHRKEKKRKKKSRAQPDTSPSSFSQSSSNSDAG